MWMTMLFRATKDERVALTRLTICVEVEIIDMKRRNFTMLPIFHLPQMILVFKNSAEKSGKCSHSPGLLRL
jgi:hypothetical protein